MTAPLTDRFGRVHTYLRVSVTDRCNYRCTYCMPEEGIEHRAREEVLSLEEVVTLCAAFARWGVERVRLTGGEPTLRRDLPWLIERLSALETTSGRPLAVVMTITRSCAGVAVRRPQAPGCAPAAPLAPIAS